MQGSEARMRVSSVMLPAVVLRHVEVGADEDALARALPWAHRSEKRMLSWIRGT
jgi:hypothetical protein